MIHATSAREFRDEMHRRYEAHFALHRVVAALLETAVSTPRPLTGAVQIALDMLMTQAYKSHYGVRLMCEVGHAEDAAVLTRRLMELAAQAAYIGENSSEELCTERAGRYLANLWREAPGELKQHIPDTATERWVRIAEQWGPTLPKRGWAPTFRDLFTAIGRLDTYEQDYRYLSSIAHGSTEDALVHYSLSPVNLRSHINLPTLLTYASRYYLALAHVWENYFHLVDEAEYKRTVEPLLHLDGLTSDTQPDAV